MTRITRVPLLVLLVLTSPLIALSLADKSPNPAAKSYSGCALTSSLSNCKSKTNADIQMGECWANSRVMGQQSAFFVPMQPGESSYDSEGGPYGTCTAYDCLPEASQMQASDNAANYCFFWDGADRTQSIDPSSSSNVTLPAAPGKDSIPMPLVCPSNLSGCYSANYFESGGELEVWANVKPTYDGVWFPPKKDHEPMFCNGLNLGCATPTMQGLQLNRLAAQNCNVDQCSNSTSTSSSSITSGTNSTSSASDPNSSTSGTTGTSETSSTDDTTDTTSSGGSGSNSTSSQSSDPESSDKGKRKLKSKDKKGKGGKQGKKGNRGRV